MALSRRDLIRLGFGGALDAARGSTPSLFEEISPAVSGITWVHENAMSERATTGDVRTGVRISRLRQRRVDGHSAGQQWTLRFLSTEDAAQRSL